MSAPVALIGCGCTFSCSLSHSAAPASLSRSLSLPLMHIAVLLCLSFCLSLYFLSAPSAPFELCHSVAGSQARAGGAIVLGGGVPFCGVASSLPLFAHSLCDEALQWMNNIPLQSGFIASEWLRSSCGHGQTLLRNVVFSQRKVRR